MNQSVPVSDHKRAHAPKGLLSMVILALGIVYGDIGTSPLYAIEVTMKAFGGNFTPADVYGVASLIAWCLVFFIAFKYIRWVMKADNQGQGGILALVNLLQERKTAWSVGLPLVVGAIGAGFLFGDGAITPAISVLSAMEGLQVAIPGFPRLAIIASTLIILAGLFAFQKRGTETIGNLFGPVMIIWFGSIAAVGGYQISMHPDVLFALNPMYAIGLFINHFWTASVLMGIIGGVFLALTGGEALYADMGHVGRRSISLSFMFYVLPSLVINYLGQAALIVANPSAVEHPFYTAVPDQYRLPMVVLATFATIIASQALISGIFSLTQQGIQMSLLPRQKVEHKSKHEINQVYAAVSNYSLMIGAMFLVVVFDTSDNLAAAYGIAVSGTMLLTTYLRYHVSTRVWHEKIRLALIPALLFGCGDVIFLSSNSLKIGEGGWIPLLVGLIVAFMMISWRYGALSVRQELKHRSTPLDEFIKLYAAMNKSPEEGVGVILTKVATDISPVIIHDLANGGHLYRDTVLYSIIVEQYPKSHPDSLIEYEFVTEVAGVRIHRVTAHFGYMERLHVNEVIFEAMRDLLPHKDLYHPHVFIPHEKLRRRPRTTEGRIAFWLKKPSWIAFSAMKKLAAEATDFFGIKRTQFAHTKQTLIWLDIDYAYEGDAMSAPEEQPVTAS